MTALGLKLWRRNPSTGAWIRVREVAPKQAATWLRYYKEKEPGAAFQVARFQPKKNVELRRLLRRR